MPLNRLIFMLALAAALTAAVHAAPDGEIRALWADSWGEGFLSPTQTDALLRDAWDGGYNTLIVEVRKIADACYRSTLEPRASNLSGDYDPLADLLRKAKNPPDGKPSLNVQAWIVVNRIWVGPRKPGKSRPEHMVNAHPDWLFKNDKGETYSAATENHMYQDPANPAVIEHMAAVVRELVGRYPIDALHLDYIRYPGREWGYSETALRRYRHLTGAKGTPVPSDLAWMDWRREQNDLLVRRIAAEARAARPSVALSASVVTWGGTHGGRFHSTDTYARALQNWPRWCKAGWMDEVYMMNYKRQDRPTQAQDYLDWINLGKRLIDGGALCSGQAAYMNTPDNSVQQLSGARQLGVGVCTYSYRSLTSEETPRATVLARFARWAAAGPQRRPEMPPPRTVVCGRVRDRAGYATDGAAVQLQVAGATREAAADGSGCFAFFDPPAGDATLWAAMGEKKSREKSAAIPAGQPVAVDLRLP